MMVFNNWKQGGLSKNGAGWWVWVWKPVCYHFSLLKCASTFVCSLMLEMQTRLQDFSSFSAGLMADLEMSEQCQNKVSIPLFMPRRQSWQFLSWLCLHTLCINMESDMHFSSAAFLFVLSSYCISDVVHVSDYVMSHLSSSGYGQNPLHSAVQYTRTTASSHTQRQWPDGLQVCVSVCL